MLLILALGCILDRTGQSVTSAMRTELLEHGDQIEKLDRLLQQYEQRISQVEEVTRARGEAELMNLDSMDQVRMELANFRNDLEVLRHSSVKSTNHLGSAATDADFRISWLEARAESLEKQLGSVPPPPPEYPTSPVEEPLVEENKTISVSQDEVKDKMADETEEETKVQKSSSTNSPEETSEAVDKTTVTGIELIKLAEKHLKQGREVAAEAVLKRYLAEFDKDKNRARALFLYAEVSFNKKEYTQAVSRFQKVLDDYNKSQWAAWALLRQGECYDALGQPENAKVFYKDVLLEYPKSAAAKDAKKKLD